MASAPRALRQPDAIDGDGVVSAPLHDHLQRNGHEPEPLPIGQPLVLDNPDEVYAVADGKVDVFGVRLNDGEPMSPRRHLFRLEPGELLFGLDHAEHGEHMALLATGTPNARIVRLDPDTLVQLAARAGPSALAAIEMWLDRLWRCISPTAPPHDAALLESGPAQTLEPGRAVRPKAGVVWVTHCSGSSEYAGRADLPPAGASRPVPLTDHAWLTAAEAVTVDVTTTDTLLDSDALWDHLEAFHQVALLAIAGNLTTEEGAERRRLEERRDADRRALASTFGTIASILNPAAATRAAVETANDREALYAAFARVAAAQGIDVSHRLMGLRTRTGIEGPRDVADAVHVRVREVRLPNGWWRQDGGPLLGTRASDGRPVALLPRSSASYDLHDPVDGTVTRVTASVASSLEPTAYTLYRPFPAKALGLLDVLRFGAQAIRHDLIMLGVLGILLGVLSTITPIVSRRLFDDVIPAHDRAQLLGLFLLLLAIAVATALLQLGRSIAVIRVQGKLDGTLQAAAWDRALRLPASFFREYSAGDLGSRVLGISTIRDLLSGTVASSILSAIFSVFNIALLFYYDAGLALVALALVIVAMAITAAAGYAQVSQQRLLAEQQGSISGLLLQIINGIAAFRIAGAEHDAFRLWAGRFAELRRTALRARAVGNKITIFTVAYPVLVSLTLFGALAITGDHLSPGTFIAFTSAFAIVIASALQLSTAAISVLAAIPIYERLRPLLVALPEIDDTKTSPGELTGNIELSHVSFRYNPDGPLILHDLSLKVAHGQFVAIVGPSGSGKSTIMRMLLGLDRPESGAIFYDNKDLSSLNVQEVRKQIGTVTQNAKIRPGLLLNNIVGTSLLTVDDAWEAARQAGLEGDIKRMPMGMYTVMSEEGSTLSGGQRQRLLIARALARKPRILLFDEATSALDNVTQEIVTRSLESMRATRIVIAHRLSTIANADYIYVVKDGRIVQEGTYRDLADVRGLFADLVKRQVL